MAATLVVYLCALAFRRDVVPQGLHNDTSEEALRGIYLVEGRHVEVITTSIGNSAETLYLYLEGLSVTFFGPTTFAIQVLSWLFALLTIGLTGVLAKRIDARLPTWLILSVTTSSLWLFHYGRSGLRAISAPLFLAAIALALEHTSRSRTSVAAFLTGSIAALSVYAYTSCRIIVIALAVHGALSIVRAPASDRRTSVVTQGWIFAGLLLFSVPNILFAFQQPDLFLSRGSYTIRGGPWHWLENIFWSILLPIHHPSIYSWTLGTGHFHDGVSSFFVTAGLDPIHPIVGLFMFVGISEAWRQRGHLVLGFLLTVWILSCSVLGFVGPSLTRMLLILPALAIFGSMGFGRLAALCPRSRALVMLGFALLAFANYNSYFVEYPRDPDPRLVNNGSATDIGQRAAALAGRGLRVQCIIAKDKRTTQLLTRDVAERVNIAEFWNRPIRPEEVPLKRERPDVILVERHPPFARFAAQFPKELSTDTPAYIEINTSGLWQVSPK